MKKFVNKSTKLIYSKTFWINLLMALLVIIPNAVELPEYTLSPETTSFIILMVNIVLRWLTNKPLEEKKWRKK